MGGLTFESAARCAAMIRKKEISPVELVRDVLTRIDTIDPTLHAFVSVNADAALDAARVAEAEVMAGKPLRPLQGVPFSVKDNIDVAGFVTTLGLKGLAASVAAASAPVVQFAQAAGAICIGKTALPELGWDSVTESPVSGITRNPWDVSRSAGGSSGGAGAALAAGMAPLAIATDGGGSIRQPASFNGVVGLKPSAGLVPIYPPSRFGALGHMGPMARCVDDVALFLDAIAGADPRVDGAIERGFAAACRGDLKGVRAGYAASINGHVVERDVAAVIDAWLETLRDAGASVEPIDLRAPGFEAAWDALYSGATAKAFDQLPAPAKTALSPEFANFIQRAARIDGGTCAAAEIRRYEIVREIHLATRHLDLVIMPATATAAFPADRQLRAGTTERVHAHADLLRLTQIWNMTGHPALSLPAGWTAAGLPVGVQIVGSIGRDALVLRAAKACERFWPEKRPALPGVVA